MDAHTGMTLVLLLVSVRTCSALGGELGGKPNGTQGIEHPEPHGNDTRLVGGDDGLPWKTQYAVILAVVSAIAVVFMVSTIILGSYVTVVSLRRAVTGSQDINFSSAPNDKDDLMPFSFTFLSDSPTHSGHKRVSVLPEQFLGEGYAGWFAIAYPAVVRAGIWSGCRR